MRGLKFRAWDKRWSWMDYDFYLSSKGVAFETPSTTYDTPNIEIEEQDNLEIMQYTGIKDIDGVEIYEGDVIDRLHDKLGYVVFSGCSFCRRVLTPKGARDYHLSAEDSPLIKIIGNIHENPELLNNKNR